MRGKKLFIGLSTGILLLIVIAFLLRDYAVNIRTPIPSKRIDTIQANTKLLIIAPHSDDETLGCAGFIKKILRKKGTVKVVVITNGDGSKDSIRNFYSIKKPSPREYLNLGIKRHGESLSAMHKLGVPKENLIFLGYPDGGTDFLWSNNWQSTNPFTDTYTKTNRSPYNFSYTPDSVYAGENEAKDLKHIIEAFKPTIILYPHPDDHHKDHWATYAFVKIALEQAGQTGKIKELLYLVHHEFWPAPYGKHLSSYLKPPNTLVNSAYNWMILSLTEKEASEKREVIETYTSQIKKMGSFLYSFARKNELFATDFIANLNSVYSKTSIQDPRDDYLLGLVRFKGGIEHIEVQNNEDGFLFTLQAKDKIKAEYTYVLDLTFFDQDQEPEKISIAILKDKINTVFHSGHQVKSNEITWHEKNASMIIKVPHPSDKIHHLLVSASVLNNATTIDRTAWKMINY